MPARRCGKSNLRPMSASAWGRHLLIASNRLFLLGYL
jgi:hypothetical protein